MATQIFELGIYQAADKDVLSKEEAIAFCAGFGQQGLEVNDFFATHDFDQWRCVQMDVYDRYSANNDPDGHMDCSPPALLGILLTSMSSEAPEQALRKYSRPDVDIRFPYNENWDIQLNHFPSCPLWICQIKNWERFSINAVVLLPEIFWHKDGPDYESYGYPYTVKYPGTYDMWYWGGRNRDYFNQRMGAFSSHRMETDGRTIPCESSFPHYDSTHHRFFLVPRFGEDVLYHNLSEDLEPQKVEFSEIKGMHVKDDRYHFYTKKGMVITDKEFQLLEKLTSKNGLPKGNLGKQEFESGDWKVMVTQSGLAVHSPTAEIVTKLSDYKLNTSSSNATRSMFTVDDKNRLVIVAGQVVLVDSDLSKTIIPLKKAFKKKLEPLLGKHFVRKDSNSVHGMVKWPSGEQWFFVNSFVFALNDHDEPVLLNERLKELCGEFIFRGAVYDDVLQGAWLMAGLERLIFLPKEHDKAYLFNIAGKGPIGNPENPYLGFDRDSNLWFSQGDKGGLRCILRKELEAKLKEAIPFQQ